MEPLQKRYVRLTEENVNTIFTVLNNKENPLTCECCEEYGFSPTRSCEGCSIANRHVKEILIESHIPLVRSIVSKLSWKHGTYRENLSAGLLALTEAVSKAHFLTSDSNISAYIRNYVTRAIKNFIIHDSIIKVPRYADAKYNFLRNVWLDQEYEKAAIPNNTELQVDLDDFLKTIPKSWIDNKVLSYLIEGGYTGKEIAQLCSMTPSMISRVKLQLEDKIRKELMK